jgi:ribosome recycling factor
MNPTIQLKQELDHALSHFTDELKKLRTGRAHPSMIEGLMPEAYGVRTPLIQMATVTAPEAQLLQISPFDPSNLQAIVKAIRDDQALGLNPVDDGRIIRIQVPALTTERRQQIVKQVREKLEDAMIASRQARQDAIKKIEQSKKDKEIGEDDASRQEKTVDEMMSKFKGDAENLSKARENEILTV